MSADALRRKLLNDEPKCKNCKHWGSNNVAGAPPTATIGVCGFNTFFRAQSLGEKLAAPMGANAAIEARYTTDLSVCSAWEQK